VNAYAYAKGQHEKKSTDTVQSKLKNLCIVPAVRI
jgi:hypothetical protein